MKNILFCLLFFLLYSCGKDLENSSNGKIPRIVVTYRSASHIVAALDMQKYLVGVHNKTDTIPLFKELRHDIGSLPVVGDKMAGLNLETLLRLDPTFVILYPNNIGFQTQKRLESLKISSEVIHVESLKQIQDSVAKIAKQLGAEEKAKIVIEEMERVCHLLAEHTSGIKESQKLSLYLSSSVSFFNTHSHEMLQHEMITKSGLKDASSLVYGGWSNISAEQLMAWNPDIIVISGSAPFSVESVLNHPRLAGLKAVQKKKVYRMPESRIAVWDFPGPDVVLGMLWLAHLAYPENFKNFLLEKELENYYRKIYNVSYKKIIEKY
ncbi:MAG: ABC transporter substrate-binding protein [Candidatus Brocadiae bacterium]|nr:ABC transporter substrate-binding protein [Candidatus Brocadiia bacterium]